MSPSAVLSAVETVRRVRERTVTAEETLRDCLGRIRDTDPGIRAFLQVLEEPALEAARDLDGRIARGSRPGPLAGVPVAVKDNILVRGARATCGSRLLKGYRAVYDAEVVERLRAADAVIVGKTNLDEFAMGSSTENSGFFPTRNPHDPERVPGGSSGGSAAAVASGMVPLALGSETGGSVRQPASFCGVVGLKPTYGLVSRFGLTAYASSLDCVGPLGRTVRDVALLLGVLAGHDPKDSTSLPGGRKDYLKEIEYGVKGLRIGMPEEYFSEGLDPAVEKSVRAAAESFRKMGASVREVSLPHTRAGLSAYYVLAPSEASANLSRFDGIRFGSRAPEARSLLELYEASRGRGFGPEVKRRIMLGTYALSSGYYEAYYRKAAQVRSLVRRDFEEAFQRADLLLTPTSPTPAFRFGERADPLQMFLADVYTVPCSMAGGAGISLPCGKTSEGLPVGLQLLARPGEEGLLLRAARAYEKSRSQL